MDVEIVDPYISLSEYLEVRLWLYIPCSRKEYDDISTTIMDIIHDNVRVPHSTKLYYDLEWRRKVVLPL